MSAQANRVLVILAAALLVWAQRLPWYAPEASSPNSTDGPVERAAWQVGHVFADVAGTRAADEPLLLVLAAAVALLAVAVGATRAHALGDVLRLAGVAPLALVVVSALTAPRGFSVHWGLLVAALAALVLANAALHGGAVRTRRPVPVL